MASLSVASLSRAGAALALGLSAMPLAAQSTFSLPPGQSTPTARPAGPVDPADPTTSTVRPRPAASPTAAPSPAVSASTAPTPAASPPPSPAPQTATAPTQRPAARATPRAASTAPAAPPLADPGVLDSLALPGAATPAPPAAAPVPAALPGGPSETAASPANAPPANGPPARPAWWPWLAGALGLLAGLGGLLIWRRRRDAAAPQIDFEPPVVAKAPPQAAPELQPAAAPAPASPAPASPAPASPAPAAPGTGLQLELVARRLDASLVTATLAYSLKITNSGQDRLSTVRVEADMVAAHASRPVEQQIASPDQRLEQRHALADLAPGETAEIKGEFRLPLAMITPIRAGNAAYFVPLARLRVEAARAGAAPVVLARTFVVGELPDQPGGALRPFRLDLGPRTFARLGQRPVN